MQFSHSDAIWQVFPELAAGVLHAEGIHAAADVEEAVASFSAIAEARLAEAQESEFPEIQAWRRGFSRMGLKPTQYRCASEALLRRFRQERTLPRLHPLIDLCNSISLAFAIPVAVFDAGKIAGDLQVRHATGHETYLTFGGESEHPEQDEVIFADDEGRAHARRWTNRQSGLSAVRETTASVLIVAEALHAGAGEDTGRLIATLADALASRWPVTAATATLTRASPRFEFHV
ncbi:B3/B4 domain-containing protein (DNA/RNA-binding domain of Phe-tRNA-synthetase) [Rhizobium aethiopicum]|uniref:B3/B4 domain-containing protein (DNA/RNA-binding domain of Phe-tRNA-synthetase) n=1 Tax=Rhizobium aethiopicum TaxID=1138170 RepID=A0A1C3XYX9_9HYPH|nr:phenylalanine--tRNA ligase beta subunit-related protein [Rhizobium aethiopicum]SCB57264.1 B3/B4 domain-containing protein (DNA/RNA-binding domain of Phe-tRNA-synthetase) [Rhizobium aethiopicum]